MARLTGVLLLGLTLQLDPAVAGRVTFRLVQVPWDQAIEMVLRHERPPAAAGGPVRGDRAHKGLTLGRRYTGWMIARRHSG